MSTVAASPRATWAVRWFPWVARAGGAAFVVLFTGAFVVVSLDLEPLPLLTQLVRWGHGGNAYELMISSIYVVWGVFLWRSARDPQANRAFIDFTVMANAAHVGTMTVMGFTMAGEHMHLAGDILLSWAGLLPFTVLWAFARRTCPKGVSS